MRTLVRDMRYFREQSIVLPLRSTIKDVERGISHRSLIIRHEELPHFLGKSEAQLHGVLLSVG